MSTTTAELARRRRPNGQPGQRCQRDARIPERRDASVDQLVAQFSLLAVEHANLQLALDEVAASSPFEVLGLPPDIGTYGGVSLAGMATGHWHGPNEPTAHSYVDVDIGEDRPLPCLRAGLLLTEHAGRPVVVLLPFLSEQRGPVPEVRVEVVAADATTLGEFVAGVAASFIKELARRAVLATLQDGGTLDDRLEACLTQLQSQRAPILRRSLAAEPSPGGAPEPGTFGPASGGWITYGSP